MSDEQGQPGRPAEAPADDEHAPRPPDPPQAPEARATLAGVATSLAEGAGNVLSAALRPVGDMTSGARRRIGERGGARVRRVRRMGQQPLANMWEEHPDARLASLRELGLRIVAVDEICGTAVEGPGQRGGDFLPLRDRRGQDWRARWQRILRAMDSMAVLPPVDLLKLGDCYWVVDGHNRVAAALYTGQVAVDANVVELRLPGERRVAAEGNLAPYLEASQELRAAGTGRLTRTSVMPSSVSSAHPPHDHAADDEPHPPDEPPSDEPAASGRPGAETE